MGKASYRVHINGVRLGVHTYSNLLARPILFRFLPIFILICLILTGCASSNVTRTTSANVDMGVRNANQLVTNIEEGNIGDSYANIKERTKIGVTGALVGGAIGAVSGSTIGIGPGAALGAIMGASYGSYFDINVTLRDQLVNRGITVVGLGDQIMVVIPSARLFNPMTANIKSSAYDTLYILTCFLNKFAKISVKVSGYTGDVGATGISYELSKMQAERVARFLYESGLNTRLLYATGYGCSKLVQKACTGWDSDNYRIEITLERLHNCC